MLTQLNHSGQAKVGQWSTKLLFTQTKKEKLIALMLVSFRQNLWSTSASQHHHLFTGYFQTSLCRLFWLHCFLCFWTMSPFKGTPWRHTRRSLQLQDVFKGADKLMAVFAFANLSFIRALKNFWSIACNCPDFLYSITSFPQPGSEEPGLHVIMLDARYDRDPTYSVHGAIIFLRHHLSYQTVAHNNNTIVT